MKSNSFIHKNGNISKNTKIKMPKIETMYDKVKDHFQSYEFIKLQLLGEDNSNYGDLFFQGYIYKPKNIKVEYLGNNKINSELLSNKEFYKKNTFFIKKENRIKNISLIKQIHYNKEKKNNNNHILDKNNISFLGKKLPLINRINNSIYFDKNNRNFNSINYENYSGKIKIIKKINPNNSKKNMYRNNCNITNLNKKNFNKSNSTKKLLNKINIYKLKKELKYKVDLLENKVNNSSNFILNGSKINKEEKPQFNLRFKNLELHFNNFLS